METPMKYALGSALELGGIINCVIPVIQSCQSGRMILGDYLLTDIFFFSLGYSLYNTGAFLKRKIAKEEILKELDKEGLLKKLK